MTAPTRQQTPVSAAPRVAPSRRAGVANRGACLAAGRLNALRAALSVGPAVLLATLGLLFSVNIAAQSRANLDTLFFDAVYPVGEDDTLLLSSGQRQGMPATMPANPQNGSDMPQDQVLSSIAEYEANIAALIEAGNTFEPALAQDYLAIGSLYQRAGSLENAKTAFENAMHIQRVNQGLFTLDQAEAVTQLIANSKAAGNYSDTDKYHEYLYYLQSRSLDPNSDAYTAASMDWAEWNLELFRRLAFQRNQGITISSGISSVPSTQLRNGDLVAVEDNLFSEVLFVPRMALFSPSRDIRSQSYTAEQLIDPRLRRAEDIYDKVLEKDPGNVEALLNKAGIVYQFQNQLEKLVSTTTIGSNITTSNTRSVRNISVIRRGYQENRESLLAYAESLVETDAEQAAQAYIWLGDWDLAADRFNAGVESYNTAREILLAAGFDEADVTQFITPEPGILVPGFAPQQYSRQFLNIPETADIPYIGYIDVTFNKTRRGDLRGISITDSSENTGSLVRNQLLDMLRDGQARPLIVTGQAEEQADIKVRYYYSY